MRELAGVIAILSVFVLAVTLWDRRRRRGATEGGRPRRSGRHRASRRASSDGGESGTSDVGYSDGGWGGGIEELETSVRHALMAGGMLFEAHAVLAAPATADETELRAALEALADEPMVGVALAEDPGQARQRRANQLTYPSSGSFHGRSARLCPGPGSD